MPLSLKTKQVVGVTLIVGLAVGALGAWYLSSLARHRRASPERSGAKGPPRATA